jgi:phosphopantothenoylcysteine decarboxylase/phosphopantothenate--cysteine ligase
MFERVKENWQKCDIGIFAAAVADYRPKVKHDQKIKKSQENEEMSIELVRNPDIIAWAGENKSKEQFLLGFALETENLRDNAKEKLLKKNLDAIVMNSLEDKGTGFGSDKNKISILDKHNKLTSFELKPKDAVARDILNYLKQNKA